MCFSVCPSLSLPPPSPFSGFPGLLFCSVNYEVGVFVEGEFPRASSCFCSTLGGMFGGLSVFILFDRSIRLIIYFSRKRRGAV